MRAKILLYLKGMAMGAADVVPGVSGGTVAFVVGVYGQLLDALSNMPQAALLFVRGRFAEAWALAHANFLLILLCGIGTSILTLAHFITWILTEHVVMAWSFFFGLVLISCYYVGREIRFWNLARVMLFVLGALVAGYITMAAPGSWSRDPLSIFFAGSIAICAMLLPGISGSFMLVLMGLYGYILESVKNFDVAVILVFGLGCVCGLLSFARLLRATLRRYHDVTLALMTGFMLGSLNKVWPWKHQVEQVVAGQPPVLLERNLWPWNYAAATGQQALIVHALVMVTLAVLLVIGIEWLARRKASETADAVENS